MIRLLDSWSRSLLHNCKLQLCSSDCVFVVSQTVGPLAAEWREAGISGALELCLTCVTNTLIGVASIQSLVIRTRLYNAHNRDAKGMHDVSINTQLDCIFILHITTHNSAVETAILDHYLNLEISGFFQICQNSKVCPKYLLWAYSFISTFVHI